MYSVRPINRVVTTMDSWFGLILIHRHGAVVKFHTNAARYLSKLDPKCVQTEFKAFSFVQSDISSLELCLERFKQKEQCEKKLS